MVQIAYWFAQYSGGESAKSAMESAGVSNPKPFVQLPLQFPDVAAKGNGSAVFGEADYGLAINKDSKNVGAAETFVAQGDCRGCAVGLIYYCIFYPTVREARARLASGELGPVHLIHGSYLQDWFANSRDRTGV